MGLDLGQKGEVLWPNGQAGQRSHRRRARPLGHLDVVAPIRLHGLLDEGGPQKQIDSALAPGLPRQGISVDREEIERRTPAAVPPQLSVIMRRPAQEGLWEAGHGV